MKTVRTMKTRIAILLVAALLLLGGVAQAQTGEPGLGYTVQAGTAGGGGYQLTALRWHASGSAVGGSYRLLSLSSTGPWGNCCCTYLPLTLRNH
ncbi:MAG: hypothetical protein KKA73_25065 [Chloroflexi bacterium]|nr:hypothetical protein [Chloroflexota bacterium]MBU1750968.1 hypothetical protein [Chloroflexota bacterium]